MDKKLYSLFIGILFSIAALAQHPFTHWTDATELRYSSRQPVIHYLLSIDSADLFFINMEMRLSNIPDTFNVAMAAHPEYDDRYWRYLEDMYVETKNGKGNLIRKDSALWQVISKGGTAVLHYRIHLPATTGTFRSAWKAFLSPAGGLVGGPHCFMYVVGQTLAPAHVTLKIPAGWQVVTGLSSTTDPNTFFASSVFILMDDPILVGKIKNWSFQVDNIPHRISYWPWPAKEFDTAKLVNGIQKLVQQASLLFGRLPYRDYSFMLQDSAGGGLEHNNSVTIGASVSQLNTNLTGVFSDIAHEYFHSWNLVRIHPVEYSDISYKAPMLSKGLWFSEGLTLFYADLLKRRAGLPSFDSTRIKHLESLIRRYAANPAYTRFSAEQVSLSSYGPTGMLGDYSASTHLQGELIGAMLDIIIRDASNGRRSIDDVMRKMMERFSGPKGFTSNDIEQIAGEICGFDLRLFFRDYVFGKKAIDLDKYLRLLGLQKTLTWKDALAADGKPATDFRAYSFQGAGETDVRIGITDPSSAWGKAGLHTGDILKRVNGTAITTMAGFRQLIRAVKIGDTVAVEVQRPTGIWKTNVFIVRFRQPEVQITVLPNAGAKQKELLAQWERGN